MQRGRRRSGVIDVGPETWTWTCTVKNASGTSFTNAATVTGEDSNDDPVQGT